MKKIVLIFTSLLLSVFLFYSCSSSESGAKSGNSLVIYCPHPLEFINPLVDDFKAKNPGINVDIIAA
ncbi:ABC transporter substrate-binding protein, partial [Brachyspira hyodysenteriae]